jgi:hypothetical protein
MSTLQEIEEAIESLPASDVVELARWLEDYQSLIGAAESVGEFYDAEEKGREAVAA